ncbi:hypothetical protein [Parashewanella tropica]|uniref:hypothetical protein n=1 Tax=Parashewanella tropica TaxID=2547970 RepID=UPI0010596309|nr:hypothetical protein [Parashewanella tropica]
MAKASDIPMTPTAEWVVIQDKEKAYDLAADTETVTRDPYVLTTSKSGTGYKTKPAEASDPSVKGFVESEEVLPQPAQSPTPFTVSSANLESSAEQKTEDKGIFFDDCESINAEQMKEIAENPESRFTVNTEGTIGASNAVQAFAHHLKGLDIPINWTGPHMDYPEYVPEGKLAKFLETMHTEVFPTKKCDLLMQVVGLKRTVRPDHAILAIYTAKETIIFDSSRFIFPYSNSKNYRTRSFHFKPYKCESDRNNCVRHATKSGILIAREFCDGSALLGGWKGLKSRLPVSNEEPSEVFAFLEELELNQEAELPQPMTPAAELPRAMAPEADNNSSIETE